MYILYVYIYIYIYVLCIHIYIEAASCSRRCSSSFCRSGLRHSASANTLIMLMIIRSAPRDNTVITILMLLIHTPITITIILMIIPMVIIIIIIIMILTMVIMIQIIILVLIHNHDIWPRRARGWRSPARTRRTGPWARARRRPWARPCGSNDRGAIDI